MEFSDTRRDYRLNQHGDFLNIGSLYCMFDCSVERTPFELAAWVNEASELVEEAELLAHSQTHSSGTPRIRAMSVAIGVVTGLLYEPPNPGDWGDRRQRKREWGEFRQVVGQWREESAKADDLDVQAEGRGMGSLADKYPWCMTITYHPVYEPGVTKRAVAWFTAEPLAVIFSEYLKALQQIVRSSLVMLGSQPEDERRRELERSLTELLLM